MNQRALGGAIGDILIAPGGDDGRPKHYRRMTVFRDRRLRHGVNYRYVETRYHSAHLKPPEPFYCETVAHLQNFPFCPSSGHEHVSRLSSAEDDKL